MLIDNDWIVAQAYGTEKFMDYGFMEAMMRSTTLPARDLWRINEIYRISALQAIQFNSAVLFKCYMDHAPLWWFQILLFPGKFCPCNDFLTDEDSGLPVFLEPEAVQLLSFWCRTPQQMRRFIGIILNAKYKVEKDHRDIGVYIPLDDEELKPLMTKTLRRYFNALRSNEKHIKDVENYLYGTMQNLFGIWWNKQAAREYAAKHPEEEKSADNDNSGLYY